MKWHKPEDWKEDTSCFPNELVLLRVEITQGKNCLVDDEAGVTFITMGHWYPRIESHDGTVEEGHWEYVGWNWCQECFVGTRGDKVIGWTPLPEVQSEA